MKKLLLFAFFVFAIEISFAQTASDYYMPLCVGNQTVLYRAPNGTITTTFTYTILETDSISGELYFLKEGKEYSSNNQVPISAFQYLWLRKDVNGEILCKAYSDVYPILDSAVILPTELLYFPNNYLTVGYSTTQTIGSNQTVSDSVVSTSANFDIFNNCIQIMETKKTSGIIDHIDELYYYLGIGNVGGDRIFPANDVHTDEFASTFVTGCDPIVDSLPPNTVDTCFGQYFDYYVNNIHVDTINHTITVTWVFQDDTITNQFIQTYNYQYPGNNVISITIQCSKTAITYYKLINIGSSPLGINEAIETNPIINIYPNPAIDFLTVGIINNQKALLSIYNLIGELVKTESINQNQQQINIGDLSNGVYMVSIKTKDLTENKKLIIQR